MLFPTTIAGSLPKPEWLAEPNKLWAPWRSQGDELARAKRDATVLAVKLQEDAGIDIVTEGEQARQHFVHGFLEKVDGIDFAHKVEMGIRKDRYKAMERLRPQPLSISTTPVTLTEDRFGSVPRWYIECTHDNAVRINLQRLMVKKTPCKVITMECGHSPFFSNTEELVEHLEAIAGS